MVRRRFHLSISNPSDELVFVALRDSIDSGGSQVKRA
jgi:hypothetical protein